MRNKDVIIRLAKLEDMESVQKIYAPYVLNTAITFEYDVPSVTEFENRYAAIVQQYPFLVAERAEEVVGYAYAGSFIERQAYDWTAELSIYVKQTLLKKGIGTKLYAELEKILRLQNVQICYACIAFSGLDDDACFDDTSILFHQKKGFIKIGDFRQCGYKFERWYHMCYMEKRLVPQGTTPKPFIPFSKLYAAM